MKKFVENSTTNRMQEIYKGVMCLQESWECRNLQTTITPMTSTPPSSPTIDHTLMNTPPSSPTPSPTITSPDQTPNPPTYAELLEEVNELRREKEYLRRQLDSATAKLLEAIKVDHDNKATIEKLRKTCETL